MRTPAGPECALYYEDFARGASQQECRAAKAPGSAEWRPEDCGSCTGPAILAANGSPRLQIQLLIRRKRLGTSRRIDVRAYCTEHGGPLGDPYAGCARCNAEADVLLRQAFD